MSLSYMEPVDMCDRILHRLIRSQRVTYQEQYEKCGIRMFDICVSYNSSGRMVLCYNGVVYGMFSLYEILGYMNSHGDCSVLFSLCAPLSDHKAEVRFKESCKAIETIYKNIRFIGGIRWEDCNQMYRFSSTPITYRRLWMKWYEYLFRRHYVKRVKEEILSCSTDCVMADFVDTVF